jgi:hypothetical protein
LSIEPLHPKIKKEKSPVSEIAEPVVESNANQSDINNKLADKLKGIDAEKDKSSEEKYKGCFRRPGGIKALKIKEESSNKTPLELWEEILNESEEDILNKKDVNFDRRKESNDAINIKKRYVENMGFKVNDTMLRPHEIFVANERRGISLTEAIFLEKEMQKEKSADQTPSSHINCKKQDASKKTFIGSVKNFGRVIVNSLIPKSWKK